MKGEEKMKEICKICGKEIAYPDGLHDRKGNAMHKACLLAIRAPKKKG